LASRRKGTPRRRPPRRAAATTIDVFIFINDNWFFTNKEKIAQVKIPVAIVTGGFDTDVSIKENAEFFAANIPNSTLIILSGQVTHWPFLNESTSEGKKINPTITIDDPSINRGEIHKQVGVMAVNFFNKHI
jgi:pimeloyl-ACP methyl ester carboxylesterase